MINLRFHIVSLVAVFFALAIGIAVGATVVDQGVLSQTQKRITQLDGDLQAKERELNSLRAERRAREKVVRELEPLATAGRLVGVNVALVRGPEVRDDSVDVIVRELRRAGATLREFSLATRFVEPSARDLDSARSALGAASQRPGTVRFLLHDRLAEALFDPLASAGVDPLVRSSFVATAESGDERIPSLAPSSVVVVLVGDRGPAGKQWSPFLEVMLERGARRLMVVHAGDSIDASRLFPSSKRSANSSDESVGGEVVRTLRSDQVRAQSVATLDSVDGIAGRSGLVFVLDDLRRGIVGHYGVGNDADRLVPRG